MPNWCINELQVSGDSELIKKFFEENKNINNEDENENSLLSFEKSVPLGNWDYDRSVEFWGCKWDASDVDANFEDGDDVINYTFSTPWGPPLPWLTKTAEKYNKLTFSMKSEEPGCDFIVMVEFDEGKLTSEYQNSLESHYWDEYGFEDKYKRSIQILFETNIVKNIIKDIDLSGNDHNSFDYEEFMDELEIENEQLDELNNLYGEVQDESNSYIFNSRMENYFTDKILPLIRFIRKFQKRTQMKKIFKLSHKIKNNLILENIEKISYMPPENDKNQTSNEMFIFNNIPTILLNKGGFHYNEILNEINI